MVKENKNAPIKIEIIETKKLIPHARNSRTHSEQQIKQIAGSIKEFGFTNPVLIDKDNGIIAGHGRVMAAELLSMVELPCVRLEHLTETQKRAYIIADNKLALNAGWDDEMLALELQEIIDDGFDADLIGFSQDELDELLNTVEDGLTDEDAVPELPEDPVSKLGDIYILGNHRLMCGDSTDAGTVALLMDGGKADLLHTDPPYNVDYSNANRPKASKKDLGKIKNDKMDGEKFYEFLLAALSCAYEFLKDNATCYIWHASAEQINFTKAFIDSGFKYTQQIIWKKPMLLGRGRYQWAHEPCLLGVKGSPFFTDDRTKTTVWDFGGYDKSKNVHPTQKPVFIPEEAINNSSKIGSNVLDLFGGSGSTLIACEKTGRNCYMMELDPKYCDVIIQRWEEFTGEKAVLNV
ncbi:MAG: site-specific DNA-methyltransferase [Candidatus Anammoxibacter sp.]